MRPPQNDDIRYVVPLLDTVRRLGLGGWLAQFEPEPGQGFLWSDAPEIRLIAAALPNIDEHSGASLAWTLRRAQHLAQRAVP
jgi:hypothetical protein